MKDRKAFYYESDGFAVSFTGKHVATDHILVTFNSDKSYGDVNETTRVDKLERSEKEYIQTRLDKKWPNGTDDLQAVGDFICEVYHGMIK